MRAVGICGALVVAQLSVTDAMRDMSADMPVFSGANSLMVCQQCKTSKKMRRSYVSAYYFVFCRIHGNPA